MQNFQSFLSKNNNFFATTFALAALVVLVPPSGAAEDDAKHVLHESIASNLPEGIADPGNVRALLSASGIQFGVIYIGEAFGNASGGIDRSRHFHGLLDIWTDIDLSKLTGWQGLSFHANAYRSFGSSITLESVGTIAAISHIEATPATRLFEAWFEQSLFDGKASLRFGQLAADAEFATLDSSPTFISSTFGWNTLMTDNLPNGGPIYPLATPGVRLAIKPNNDMTAMLAVYNGDPVGSCDGDPQQCNNHGIDFRVSDPPLVIAEVAYDHSIGLPGTIKLGGWRSFKTFDDQRFDAEGRSLADPVSKGEPRRYDENYGIYAVIYQMLYRVPETSDKGVHVFARVAGSPSHRNQVDFYVEGGLTFAGMFTSRPDDSFGIGIAYTHVSNNAANLDRDTRDFNGQAAAIRNYELLLELSYKAQVLPGWTLQPDFQYYWNPGGNGIDPADPADRKGIPNTAILGLRTTVSY